LSLSDLLNAATASQSIHMERLNTRSEEIRHWILKQNISLNAFGNADRKKICLMNKNTQKAWWVPPECNENLASDCDNIKTLWPNIVCYTIQMPLVREVNM
jgi:hypothetical protein